jgi:hypothetical protein
MKIIPMDPEERARARRSDPETSHMAAESVSVRENQVRVYQVLSQLGPSTDEWLVACYPMYMSEHPQSPSGIRTRRKELWRKGLVKWTGKKVRGKTNRLMRVWTVVSEEQT